MSIIYASQVSAPLDEVFAWHARPGAIARLLPPWQPVRIARESTSLQDGTAILALPAGLRWVAQHQPAGYDPPRRFVDEFTSFPLRAMLRWRHTHEFTAIDDQTTQVIDHVETTVPDKLLRPTFVYRHQQLAADLAAHRWSRSLRSGPLTVAVTGSTGLIGSALAAFLTAGGHRVIRLVRHTPRNEDEREWQPAQPDPKLLAGVDVLVHLAGASIAGRFDESHKDEIRESRIDPTRKLAELAANTSDGPRCFVSASAIGYYGPDRGDEELTESSPRGDGFLANVVADWEGATEPAAHAGIRVVHVRTGIAQSPLGGTLRLLRPLFTAGLGGRLSDGRQWTSWIGIDDLIDIYHRALIDTDLAGAINAVAPEPVRNAEYTRTLARVLHRPAMLPVPAFGPRLLLGREGASELAEASQLVKPERLLRAGHQFRHSTLEPALRHLLGRSREP